MQNIIIRPVITEKSMANAQKGIFTFVVASSATKDAIKRAIEKAFSVHITKIRTAITKGRSQRTGARRVKTKIQQLKKAIVTVKSGEKIDLFEVGA